MRPDFVTRQFIFLTKKFRKELRKYNDVLHHDLTRLSDGVKNLKDAISTERKADKKADQTNPAVSVSDFRANVPIPVQDKTKKTIPEWAWAIFKGTLEI